MVVVLAVALATVLMASGALLLARANRTRHLPWLGRPPVRPWPTAVLPALAVVPTVHAAERLHGAHDDLVAILLTWSVPLGSAALVQALHNRAVSRAARG